MKQIAVTLMIGVACIAAAQEGMHMGIKVTPQSTVLINKDNSDNAHYRDVPVWGFAYGLSFDYHFKPKLGIGLDLIHSAQGAKFEEHKENSSLLNGTNRLRLRYFKIPVLLHFNSNPEQPVLFVGQVGVQFGFLTKAELEVRQDTSLIMHASMPYRGKPGTYDVKNVYSKVSAGAILGLGIGTNFGTDYLMMTLQLRFDFTFTDAEDKPRVTDDLDAATKAWYYYFYPTDPERLAADRPATFQALGGIEWGFKYILKTGKKKKV